MEGGPHTTQLVAALGFAIAFIFGYVGNKTSFCTLGAVSDVVNMGDWRRMRMWLVAIAVAILGANGLALAGLVDLSKSFYTGPNFTWLSFIVGGLLFGVGMTLASGCGSKTLIRIGGGNLKSVVVAVFLAIAAYMTLKGLFAQWRVTLLAPVAINFEAWGLKGQDLPTLFAAVAGDRRTWQLAIALALGGALLAFAFKDRGFRESRDYILGGVVVGLLVAAGWYVTGHLGYRENPETLDMAFFGTNSRQAESLTFVAPFAYALELLMLWSDKSLGVSFGVAAVAGVIAGSLAYALVSRTFRWESFTSAADMGRHMLGGALMGFGGVTALGCTVGQGISGFSTLALGSILTFFALVAGAVATMKFEYWRMLREA
ncbi:MAG: YeeE/YedE family protein [Burkholderiales bacterium]